MRHQDVEKGKKGKVLEEEKENSFQNSNFSFVFEKQQLSVFIKKVWPKSVIMKITFDIIEAVLELLYIQVFLAIYTLFLINLKLQISKQIF